MFSFTDIIAARRLRDTDPELLSEASLARVWQHFKHADSRSFAIVTSWRGGMPDSGESGDEVRDRAQKNKKDWAHMAQMLRSWGLGYVSLKGSWLECSIRGVDYDDCPNDKLVRVSEPALFVVGITKDQVLKIAQRFEQDAVVFAGPETKGRVHILGRNGDVYKSLGKFSPKAVASGFSQVRGRPFVFEYITNSFGERLLEQHYTPSHTLQEIRLRLRELIDAIDFSM